MKERERDGGAEGWGENRLRQGEWEGGEERQRGGGGGVLGGCCQSNDKRNVELHKSCLPVGLDTDRERQTTHIA